MTLPRVGISSLRAKLIINTNRKSAVSICSRLKYSTSNQNGEGIQKSPEQEKKEAAELAMQSIKDIGGIFSSSSSDEATQPIETKAIFENPKLFGSLSLLHQGQVLKELQSKFDGKWKKLTEQDKKLSYYIYYGNWGVREEFSNWKSNEAPFDLPFHAPSKLKTSEPTASTKIEKVNPPVILSETPVRAKQFDFKRVDGVSKFFIYLTIFISIFAIYRDKNIGEEGKPIEVIIEDEYEKERKLRQAKLEQELLAQKILEDKKSNRKWYYLWLK